MTELSPVAGQGERSDRVRSARERWSKELFDLSGRNTLLYYKDLKVGTLDLVDADPAGREELLTGRATRLSRLFRDPERYDDALKRVRAIRRKVRELEEERGINAGYLAVGMATWEEEGKTPASPVLLRPATLKPVSARQGDFTVELDEESEVNPVLCHALETQFSIVLPDSELSDLANGSGPFDPGPVFERIEKLVDEVSGFRIARRLVAGTFSYAKLPMVRDLEHAEELLVASDVVAALAGDQGAVRAIRTEATAGPIDPDRLLPTDEFLVLDADSSQSVAINTVVAGSNLVLHGPPGTGKSQTIANLIATLVARGRKVLFVAEKRAAIDAVLHRLDQVGLADLVMDLHDGGANRRQVARQLDVTLDRAASVTRRADPETLHRRLVDQRARLREHRANLHEPRQPWGVSAYDVQVALLGMRPEAASGERLSGSILGALHDETVDDVRDQLHEYAALGGFTLSPRRTPWCGAAIQSAEDAERAYATAARLGSQLFPTAQDSLGRVLAECGLAPPRSLADWRHALALLDGVRSTLRLFKPEVYDAPLDDLVAATASRRWRRERGVHTSWRTRRDARKAAKALWSADKPARGQLHAALVAAAGQRRAWADRSRDGAQPRAPVDLSAAEEAYQQVDAALRALGEFVQTPSPELSPQDFAGALDRFVDDETTPQRLPRLYELDKELRRRELDPLLEELAGREASPEVAVLVFDHVWYRSILDHLRFHDHRYAAFAGDVLTHAVDEFGFADRSHIATNADRIRQATAEALYAAREQHPEQDMAVRREAGRQRRHKHIRRLLPDARDVLLALKPCWAMSPLVVSQVLPAERLFDAVVFDEASQVPPADAVCSIMRGRRVVVAGDEHQLPPTSFFVTASESEDEEEEDAGPAGSAGPLTASFDSILEVLATLGLPRRWLAWHYRSRDQRLIAFSNEKVYDRRLTTFPGVESGGCLRNEVVAQTTGVAGQEESVAAEVSRVVELVLDHAERRPRESLGVIAMGIKHANRIEEALLRALKTRSSLERFFAEDSGEPFFVKNLERVQGDERDAIILSIGYGRSADGRLRYNFGPINKAGGERRLNVAVTRAKQRLTVVSSFGSYDLDPRRLHAEGARLLRAYLEYAESGGRNLGSSVDEQPALNPFESDVRDRLTAAGIPVFPQYGVAGYRIDFAAAHPERPGQMVLAIEADGASYHSAETVRDRDRLRQEHLERLGWVFHRIWSTDWFRDPEAEVARVRAAYDRVVARPDEPTEPDGERIARPARPRAAEPQAAGPARTMPRPSVTPGLTIADYLLSELVEVARWVESDGRLRTEEEAIRQVMTELGFRRLGKRVDAALRKAVRDARARPRPASPEMPVSPPPAGSLWGPRLPAADPPSARAATQQQVGRPSESPPTATDFPGETERRIGQRAHRRLTRELTWVADGLTRPSEIVATDRAAAEAQRRRRQRNQEELRERQAQLQGILESFRVDPVFTSGDRVYPGCVVGLRYEGEGPVEHVVVSCMPDEEHDRVSPFSPLGHALTDASVGQMVTYESPSGERRVVVDDARD